MGLPPPGAAGRRDRDPGRAGRVRLPRLRARRGALALARPSTPPGRIVSALVPGHRPARGRGLPRRDCPPLPAGRRRPQPASRFRGEAAASLVCAGHRARRDRHALLRCGAWSGGAADRARSPGRNPDHPPRTARRTGKRCARECRLVRCHLGALRRTDRRWRSDDGGSDWFRRLDHLDPPARLRRCRRRLSRLRRLRRLGRAPRAGDRLDGPAGVHRRASLRPDLCNPRGCAHRACRSGRSVDSGSPSRTAKSASACLCC